MAKMNRKNIANATPYVPKLDTEIFVYIHKNKRLLTPIPYKYKPNYNYIKSLINDKDRIHTNQDSQPNQVGI
jgi:hypothetical protein